MKKELENNIIIIIHSKKLIFFSDDKQQKVAFTIVYNYENGKLVSQTYVEDNETYPVTKADIEHCNINSANKQLDYLLNNKRY